ncbi:DUF3871 family protein [Flaviaesturariibacter amylovorans]|uniref:DUF3871 family protein n=1 Tax=Flaviaesturariibacter amylovorans TaxID=1084520 RepID=A0ABP8H6F8_9BACT
METSTKPVKGKKKPLNETEPVISGNVVDQPVETSPGAFISANTVESSLDQIQKEHVIPVFVKDNEPVISHADFIECTQDIVRDIFHGETIMKPAVRLSHEIKGRIPEARNKPSKELLDHERTIYYERMAFLINIPSIADEVGGNTLSLTIGGVKAYNLDNLYSKKGTDEHFKVFIGFQVKVCTNLCVWTDGFVGDLKVKNLDQLKACIKTLLANYNGQRQLEALNSLNEYSLTEHQFAQLIGRCRMYNYLPSTQKAGLTPLLLNDTQLSSVVRDYYRDESFCRMSDGNINLWKLYNLFTSTNKSSYIDTFADRSVNCFDFVSDVKNALSGDWSSWFLS